MLDNNTRQGWFTTLLGKAHCLNGQIEMAQDLAQQGLKISRDSRFWYAVGLGQRTLGHIAQSVGKLAAAKAHLQEALTTFHSIQARCEVARTHLDLALLAHTQGQLDTATTHLSTAYAWFKKLQVPKWVEKTEQLAREYGVTLKEVELEELTEDGA